MPILNDTDGCNVINIIVHFSFITGICNNSVFLIYVLIIRTCLIVLINVQIHIHYVHTYLNLYMYEFGRRRQEDVKKKQPSIPYNCHKKK